jgi:hypothetical protein
VPVPAGPVAHWSTPPAASALPFTGAGSYSGTARWPGRSRGRMWLTVAIVVLLAAASATGGWFFLSRGSQPAAARATASPVGLSQPQPAGGEVGATTASGGGSAPQGSPSPATVTEPSPPPVGQVGLVAIGPAADGPAARHVAAFLSRYFQAINAKDYPAYRSMYDPSSNPAQSEAGFRSGYRTTHDSVITLATLIPSGTGGWLATVTFTSQQDPSESSIGTSCTQWRVLYALAPAGAKFVLEHAPPGYHASAQPCPS